MKHNKNILPEDQIKYRVLCLKAEIKKLVPTSWLTMFLEMYPEYDNHKSIMKVNNVFHGRSINEDIVHKLEDFLNDLKNA